MQHKEAKKIFIILFVVFVHFELFVKADGFGGIEIADKNALLRSKRAPGNAARIGLSVVGPLFAGGGVLVGTKEIKKHGEKENDTKVLGKENNVSAKPDGKRKPKGFLENGDYLWMNHQ